VQIPIWLFSGAGVEIGQVKSPIDPFDPVAEIGTFTGSAMPPNWPADPGTPSGIVEVLADGTISIL
jgi:hypothetical protein